MIKAVIYDMDDLMVNSDPLHAQAWEQVLQEYGHSFQELPKELRSGFIGMRVSDICEKIISHFKLEVIHEEFYNKRIKIFLELVKTKLTAMSGLHHSLDLCKNNGLKIAIASS